MSEWTKKIAAGPENAVKNLEENVSEKKQRVAHGTVNLARGPAVGSKFTLAQGEFQMRNSNMIFAVADVFKLISS